MHPVRYDCNDPRAIFYTAETFYALSDFANHTADLMTESNDTTYVYNMISAALTNQILACELYLKCISCIEKNTYLHGHEPLKLFKDLKPNNQDKIKLMYLHICITSPLSNSMVANIGKEVSDDIEILFSQAKTALKDLRYIFEKKVKNYNMHFVAAALRKFILLNKPEWEQLLKLY